MPGSSSHITSTIVFEFLNHGPLGESRSTGELKRGSFVAAIICWAITNGSALRVDLEARRDQRRADLLPGFTPFRGLEEALFVCSDFQVCTQADITFSVLIELGSSSTGTHGVAARATPSARSHKETHNTHPFVQDQIRPLSFGTLIKARLNVAQTAGR